MIYTQRTNEVLQLLSQFKIAKKQVPLWIAKYETLSPDSCIWLLTDGLELFDEEKKNQHALYVEDHVPSLEHVKLQAEKWSGSKFRAFVPVKSVKTFEESSPNKAADFYQVPEGVDEMMKYAGEFDIYFVFLIELQDGK